MARNQKNINETALSAPRGQSVKQEQSETKDVQYVVVRDGYRVSSQEYLSQSDPTALDELRFWKTVEKKHSWGAPVNIVKYDNRIHRIW